MKSKEVPPTQGSSSAYTSVVTEYKHSCKDNSCKDLHKNKEEPKPRKV